MPFSRNNSYDTYSHDSISFPFLLINIFDIR